MMWNCFHLFRSRGEKVERLWFDNWTLNVSNKDNTIRKDIVQFQFLVDKTLYQNYFKYITVFFFFFFLFFKN